MNKVKSTYIPIIPNTITKWGSLKALEYQNCLKFNREIRQRGIPLLRKIVAAHYFHYILADPSQNIPWYEELTETISLFNLSFEDMSESIETYIQHTLQELQEGPKQLPDDDDEFAYLYSYILTLFQKYINPTNCSEVDKDTTHSYFLDFQYSLKLTIENGKYNILDDLEEYDEIRFHFHNRDFTYFTENMAEDLKQDNYDEVQKMIDLEFVNEDLSDIVFK